MQRKKEKTPLELAIENLQKNINELKVCAEDLTEMSYDEERCVHNFNSIEYTHAIRILDCAIGLEIQLKSFRRTPSNFQEFSKTFTEDLEKLDKETHSDLEPCQLAGIIIKNLLIGLTVIGVIVFAGKAIYAATTKEGLNPHSIFYGTRKAHTQKIHEAKSNLDEIEKHLPTQTKITVIN